MSGIDMSGLKRSDFKTTERLQRVAGGEVPTKIVKIDDRAATRQAIIVSLRRSGIAFRTRSEWKAKAPVRSPDADWNYHAIALHHAGNSFSCSADAAEQMREAEAIDFSSFKQLSYHYAIDCQGVIYEALDIREKGAHIEGGNTGVVGIVFLADFSVRGEAEKYGPGVGNVAKKRGVIAGLKEWMGVEKDKLAVAHDEPTDAQIKAVTALTKTLKAHFRINKLGGHREFAKTHGSSRACPGAYGMILANMLREELGVAAP